MIVIGGFEIAWWLIILVLFIIVVVAFFIVNLSIKAHRLQVGAGREDLIGKTAEVKITLEPKGVVFVEGERWSAEADAGPIETGEEVIITKVDGLKLYVAKKQ